MALALGLNRPSGSTGAGAVFWGELSGLGLGLGSKKPETKPGGWLKGWKYGGGGKGGEKVERYDTWKVPVEFGSSIFF